ncbi:MAG: TrkA family potassium uptake protein [Desulfurococcales archaeon]|nr:TrkA family potassium uptake protein [Desulfurococcales archaeon]
MKILIIGAGRVGSHLAKLLSRLGHDITIVDKDEQRILSVMSVADAEGLARDVTDPSFFEEIDLSRYDVVVAATDRDEVNLFVSSIAKLYNVERIFVRAKNPQTVTLLNMIGVESAVVEPVIAANILFSHIQGKYEIVNLVSSLSGEFFLVAGVIKETSRLRGKLLTHAIREGLIPPEIRVLAVFDGERFYDIDEAPVLEVGHIVIALVTERSLKTFSELV